MQLRYAHLCDYAGLGSGGGKPIVVGIFDTVYDAEQVRPIRLPISYFVARIDASLAGGTEHDLQIVVSDEDEEEVHRFDLGATPFSPGGPGRPLSTHLIMLIAGLEFPERGDYNFQVIVDGEKLGATPLYIAEPPPT